jgi:hypothetical protein
LPRSFFDLELLDVGVALVRHIEKSSPRGRIADGRRKAATLLDASAHFSN